MLKFVSVHIKRLKYRRLLKNDAVNLKENKIQLFMQFIQKV